MCGIAGCIQPDTPAERHMQGLERMLAAISHRGPDDAGIWTLPTHGLGLAHRRLAIQDLSSAGHQPMFAPDGSWGLVYNGEIYNAEALRAQLPNSIRWRGTSDTEVLLAAFQHWGIETTLPRVLGMFAMAVWQRDSQQVTLIRDRLGIKPLYYSIQGSQVFWASELKSLLAHPDFQAEIDPAALRRFLRFGYISAPSSIFRQTWKLRPGTWLRFRLDQPHSPVSHTYWDAAEVAAQGRQSPLAGDERELAEATRSLLSEVVADHLVADVPVGAFLSGGIDSSLVVALMRQVTSQPLHSFAIGFDEPEFDEAPYAKQVADTLDVVHCESYVSSRQIVEWIPRWPALYCEPFSDTSGLPTLLVSHLARQSATVVLTGDGGDELFAGYRRYQQAIVLDGRLRRVPAQLRQLLSAVLELPSTATYQQLEPLQRWLAGGFSDGLAESVRKTRMLLSATHRKSLYECLASISYDANRRGVVWDDDPLPHGDGQRCPQETAWRDDWDLLSNMQLWDSQVYLPNDILHKVDIASMAVGLEVRVPLLDHRVYEWAWRIPDGLKMSGGQGKVILRRVLDRFLPSSLINRPKRGFSAPLDGWLRGPLRDWAESLLEPSQLEASGLLRENVVHGYWNDLLLGRAGHARIWPLLVFLAWQQHYGIAGSESAGSSLPADLRTAPGRSP